MSDSNGIEKKTHVIYGGLDTTQNHPNAYGDPFFGVYTKPVIEQYKFVESKNYEWKKDPNVKRGLSPVKFNLPIGQDDLKLLKDSLSMQNTLLFNPGVIRAVSNSLEAFVGVSKKEISQAFFEGFQTPQGTVYSALCAMTALSMPSVKDASLAEATEVSRLATIAYGLVTAEREGARGFCISAQEFRSGDFESNPLTADEIKAIPYLSGFYDEVYANAGVDLADVHAPHAASIAKKFQDAGFPVLANAFAKKNNLELQVERPARKNDLDDGPGF